MTLRHFLSLLFCLGAASISANVIEVKDMAHLDQILKKGKPVFVDIFTVWCGPCKMVAPIIEELSQEHPHIIFVKINAEAGFGRFTAEHGVNGYPTFILFSASGKKIDQFSGSNSKGFFKRKLEKLPTGPVKEVPRHEVTPEEMPVRAEPTKPEMTIPTGELTQVIVVDKPEQFTKEVVESRKPVVIQFTDHPCRICARLEKIIDKLSIEKNFQNIKFVRIFDANKKLQGILPKRGGLLILPDYQFISMTEFEKISDDRSLEMRVKEKIGRAHNIAAMPKIVERTKYESDDNDFWRVRTR